MEKPDDEKLSYPEGYEHVEDRVNQTKRQVRDIDKQIENLPPNSKPAPRPAPPGMRGSGPFVNRDRAMSLLQDRREQLLQEGWTSIEKDTRSPENKNAGAARDTAREALFPNPFRKMSLNERAEECDKLQHIQHKQDYIEQVQNSMDAVRLDKAKERTSSQLEAKSAVEAKETDTLSPAERYARSLRFDRYQKEGIEITKAGPEPDRV